MAFHANYISIEDEENYCIVGFDDSKFDTEQYLLLQRSYEDDEQYIALCMNTYYVERNSQGFSNYGGIQRFVLHTDKVEIQFDQIGCQRLGVGGLEISFNLDGEIFERLNNQLQRVFAGSNCLVLDNA